MVDGRAEWKIEIDPNKMEIEPNKWKSVRTNNGKG